MSTARVMNAPTPIAVLHRMQTAEPGPADPPPPAPQRFEWQSRFGVIVIEVIGDRSFVNGQPVEPAEAAGP